MLSINNYFRLLSTGIKTIIQIVPYFRRYLKHHIVITILSSIVTIANLIIPFTPKLILDNGIASRDIIYIYNILIFTFIVSIATYLINIYIDLYNDYLKKFISYETERRYYNMLFNLDEEFIETQGTGDIISRSSGLESGISFISSSMNTILSTIIKLIAIPTALAIMDWRILIISLPAFMVSNIVWFVIQNRIRPYIYKSAEYSGKLNSYLYEMISSLSDLRLAFIYNKVINNYYKHYRDIWKIKYKASILSIISSLGQTILSLTTTLITTMIGWNLILSNEWTLGKMMTLTIAYSYITQPFQTLFGLFQMMINTNISVDRYFSVYNAQQIYHKGELPFPKYVESLSFINMSYYYKHSTSPILENIDIKFEHCSITAITGDSGSGKTTLSKLLAGVLYPTSGNFQINDSDITQIEYKSLRNNIAYLSQNPYFISGSIIDNIKYGSNINLTNVEEIMSLMHLNDNSKGLMFRIIEEGGRNLSGGEKQRIALARIMINPKPIIILDEPLSQVDQPTVLDILENIKNILKIPKRICVIVTHNPDVLSIADKVLTIYNHKISQLMEKE